MDIKIESITKDHFTSLISLFVEFANFQNARDKLTNSIEQMREEENYIQGFVAQNEDNEIIGYVIIFFAYYTWVGKSLYMDDLYVRPNYRGKGIGSQLLQQVASFAKENNCKRLRWQVSDWNAPAIEFYKTIGAKISSEEMNCDIIF